MPGKFLSLVRFYLWEALYCKIMQYICKNIHLPFRVKTFPTWEEKGFPAHAKWCLQAIVLHVIPKRWSDKHCNYMHFSYSPYTGVHYHAELQKRIIFTWEPVLHKVHTAKLSFCSSTRCLIVMGPSILRQNNTFICEKRESRRVRFSFILHQCMLNAMPPPTTYKTDHSTAASCLIRSTVMESMQMWN